MVNLQFQVSHRAETLTATGAPNLISLELRVVDADGSTGLSSGTLTLQLPAGHAADLPVGSAMDLTLAAAE
jgi:hypothetical protein